MIDISHYKELFQQLLLSTFQWLSSAQFYSQIGLILLAVIISYSFSQLLKSHSPLLNHPPKNGQIINLRQGVYALKELVFPLMMVLILTITKDLSHLIIHANGVVKVALSFSVIHMLYSGINRFVEKKLFRKLSMWILLPIAILYIFGWLNLVVQYLETISVEIGSLHISVYGVARVLIFGSILFWIGKHSSNTGKHIIRNQRDLDIGTREVFAKLFQVALFFVIFLLLLQVMGINLTALTVFGGAIGVGIGFGLQAIASNFISGIIILLDHSLKVGDYVEMDDGRSGVIRELDMRSTTLETFDGRDIMVPNEQFITSSFTNWTHKNIKQRYSLEFQVSYKTDLNFLLDIVRETVASHPQVISGDDLPMEERPDAEIKNFGDSGVNILVEFWMEGIDDGPNKVGADLLLMIWNILKEHNIQIPFPQREVKIINSDE